MNHHPFRAHSPGAVELTPLLAQHERSGMSLAAFARETDRDLRHVVTGRKTWMIFGSQRGGEVAARLFSLVISAKIAGVNVQDYLEDALSRVSTVKAKDVAVLTPWGWGEEQEKAATSPAG